MQSKGSLCGKVERRSAGLACVGVWGMYVGVWGMDVGVWGICVGVWSLYVELNDPPNEMRTAELCGNSNSPIIVQMYRQQCNVNCTFLLTIISKGK